MKDISKKIKKLILQQLLVFMLVVTAFMSPVSTYLENVGIETTVTVQASSYNSWLNDWGLTDDTYDGISGLASEDDDPDKKKNSTLDWLGDTLEAVISILIKNFVGSLLLLLTQGMGMTIENIVFGPILGSSTACVFQFTLKDGNIWGVGGSLLYAVLRNFMFAIFAIQFVWMLGVYLLKGTGKGKAELKDTIYNYVFLFSLLYAMPILVDIVLFFRDAMLKGFLKIANTLLGGGSGSFTLGVTDLILQNSEDDYTIAGAIILCFTLGASFIFAFDYIKRAIQQTYLFGVFPVVAFRSFSDKGILNKWIGHFITSLFIPVLDCVGLMLVCLIQSNNGGLAHEKGPAYLGLLIFMSIIPCRNMVAQLFGMPVSGGGFGLMAAAAMAMRALNRKPNKDDSKGPDSKNSRPETGGDGNTIGGPNGDGNTNNQMSNADGIGTANEMDSGDGGAGGASGSGISGNEIASNNSDTSYEYGDDGNISSSTETVTTPDGSFVSTTNNSYDSDGMITGSTTTYADGTSEARTITSTPDGGKTTETIQNMDAGGAPIGSTRTVTDSYDSGESHITRAEYDASGNKISELSESRDVNGDVTGTTRVDNTYAQINDDDNGNTQIDNNSNLSSNGTPNQALDDKGGDSKGLETTTETKFDANGNRISDVKETHGEDGSLTRTSTQYDPVSAKPIAQEKEVYAPGDAFASKVTQTELGANGKPTAMTEYGYNGQTGKMQSQKDVNFNDKGQPITATTTSFDENGNKTNVSVDNNVSTPLKEQAKDSAREKLNNFKNSFTPPTVSTIDTNGNEKKVQDQDAIKKQIALAERKIGGYAHKPDGTVDWAHYGGRAGDAAYKTATAIPKVIGVGAAMSAAALGGPQAMAATGMAATMAVKGSGSNNASQTTQTAETKKETTTKVETNASSDSTKKAKLEKRDPNQLSPRRKKLSKPAQAAERIKNKIED